MKRIFWISLFFVMAFGEARAQGGDRAQGATRAQITIRIQSKAKATDLFSNAADRKINSSNTVATTRTSSNVVPVTGFKNVITTQYKELRTTPLLTVIQPKIERFILNRYFSATYGYNSYGYVKKKYPILALTPSSIFKNKVIRTRIYLRLKTERNKIRDYLNPDNPMPEGERVLNILRSLENVINITLENATY